MAIGFPPEPLLQQIFLRHESVGLSLRTRGLDELGGSAHPKTIPRTILPVEIFYDWVTRWFKVLAARWRWAQHINPGELRAALIWLSLLGRVMDLRSRILLDISDNEVCTFSLAHGRSSSPGINPLLLRRACLEIVTGALLVSTWTSTLFQPGDEDTRLEDAA